MGKMCAKPDPRGFVKAHTRPHLSEPASQKDRLHRHQMCSRQFLLSLHVHTTTMITVDT